jgi:hypothetical protein
MRRLPFAIALLMLASAATAQVYKWTDHHGTVHYSQTPPAAGVHYTRITTSGSEQASTTADSQPALDSSDGGSAPASASTAPAADTPENRTALCASLKSNLSVLNSTGPVMMQGDGKALDKSQREQQIAAAEAQYKQYCSE